MGQAEDDWVRRTAWGLPGPGRPDARAAVAPGGASAPARFPRTGERRTGPWRDRHVHPVVPGSRMAPRWSWPFPTATDDGPGTQLASSPQPFLPGRGLERWAARRPRISNLGAHWAADLFVGGCHREAGPQRVQIWVLRRAGDLPV